MIAAVMLIILVSLKLMNELQNPDKNTDAYKNIESQTKDEKNDDSAERKVDINEKD